ncbi:MAG: PilZ domain-containing protein [Deltaproteobacteria bacterium]|nr:PilZ domain-containing protein [Deltaproteobacteria bacterium]MBW2071833.1 PilZ domain-containing protein [Deltaproteobacteria bacterium]
MSAVDEQSSCPKGEIRWPVIIHHDGQDLEGITRHLSPDGGFIRCHKPLALNKVFDMTIKAPDHPFEVRAEVVWSNMYGPDDHITPRGMGVRFLRIAGEDRRFIAQEVGQVSVGKAACEYLETLETDVDKV